MSSELPSSSPSAPFPAAPEGIERGTFAEFPGVDANALDFNVSRHQMDLALEAGRMGAWEWDIENARVYWSPQLHHMFGIPLGSFEGTLEGYRKRLHPDDRDLSLAKVQDALARRAETHHVTHRALLPNGEVRWLRAHARFFYAPDGRPLRLVGVTMDITELHDTEEELRRQHAIADRANRAKSEFLATMSHELRTPLNAIGGFAQLVEDELYGPVTDGQREAMQRIRRAQEHLLTLINDILHFSKIESGHLQLVPEPVEVSEIAHELIQLMEPQATDKGIAFASVADSSPTMVLADRSRLQQILLNLLGNAIKFTERGSIRLSWVTEETTVRISVQDTGRGIRASDLTKIFEPFEQVARESKPGEGVGLGLAISRELARAMGGDVTAQSIFGDGSTFTLALPLA